MNIQVGNLKLIKPFVINIEKRGQKKSEIRIKHYTNDQQSELSPLKIFIEPIRKNVARICIDQTAAYPNEKSILQKKKER